MAHGEMSFYRMIGCCCMQLLPIILALVLIYKIKNNFAPNADSYHNLSDNW